MPLDAVSACQVSAPTGFLPYSAIAYSGRSPCCAALLVARDPGSSRVRADARGRWLPGRSRAAALGDSGGSGLVPVLRTSQLRAPGPFVLSAPSSPEDLVESIGADDERLCPA